MLHPQYIHRMDTRTRYTIAPTIYMNILWVSVLRGRNILWVQRYILWVTLRIYCGRHRGIYCGQPIVGEKRIYCGQHVTYILWVTHNIYVVHPQHIRAAPTSVTHNIIDMILWVTYCGYRRYILWVIYVYIVDNLRYILWITEIYIVGNLGIYCGYTWYILWTTWYMLWTTLYVYVVDYSWYMLWIFHNICTCTVILIKKID